MSDSVLEERCEGQAMAPTETFRFEGSRLVRETRAGSFFGVSEWFCQRERTRRSAGRT